MNLRERIQAARAVPNCLRFMLAASGLFFCTSLHGQQLRPLNPTDVIRLQDVAEVPVASPDGNWLAYVIEEGMVGTGYSDVWLVSTSGGSPRRITSGASDGTKSFSPAWSPDSRTLAMISTRDGFPSLWVWSVETGEFRRLTQRSVQRFNNAPSIYWVSRDKVMVALLPPGHWPADSSGDDFRNFEDSISEKWAKGWAGKEATPEVFQSGIPTSLAHQPSVDLTVVELDGNSYEVLTSPKIETISASPNRKRFVVTHLTGIEAPLTDESLRNFSAFKMSSTLIDPLTGVVIPEMTGRSSVENLSVGYVGYAHRWTWSSDETEVATIYQRSVQDKSMVLVCSARQIDCDHIPLAVIEPLSLQWSASGAQLFAYGVSSEHSEGMSGHWWSISRTGSTRRAEVGQDSVPAELTSVPGNKGFLYLSKDEIGQFDPDENKSRMILKRPGFTFKQILWTGSTPGKSRSAWTILVKATSNDNEEGYYWVSQSFDSLTRIQPPVPNAFLVMYLPVKDCLVWWGEDHRVTRYWIDHKGHHIQFVELNGFLEGVSETRYKQIKYRGLDGGELRAWIMLPYGFKEGIKYPLIVEVYPGAMYEEGDPPGGLVANTPELLSAHGFAVLFPSMPVKPLGVPDDPYIGLANGVMPAIDKAIETGVADSSKLGLLGTSFGGYAVYGLLTQTNRFTAAIAFAGPVDLISMYGVLQQVDPIFPASGMGWCEFSQGAMGTSPWRDSGRYVRNSPLFYADRVETPIMIVQGDMDQVPVEQGEEFFMAMYRQNKRAELVRYRGEGHIIGKSSANVLDIWARTYRWLDEFLGGNSGGPVIAH